MSVGLEAPTAAHKCAGQLTASAGEAPAARTGNGNGNAGWKPALPVTASAQDRVNPA